MLNKYYFYKNSISYCIKECYLLLMNYYYNYEISNEY